MYAATRPTAAANASADTEGPGIYDDPTIEVMSEKHMVCNTLPSVNVAGEIHHKNIFRQLLLPEKPMGIVSENDWVRPPRVVAQSGYQHGFLS